MSSLLRLTFAALVLLVMAASAYWTLSTIGRGIDLTFWFYAVLTAGAIIGVFIPSLIIKQLAYSLGIVLIAQPLLTAFLEEDYKTLEPNLAYDFVIEGDQLNGIFGQKHFETDAMGFRTNRAVDYQVCEKTRLFAIGASTTAQGNLGNNELWSTRIGNAVDGEAINTGVPGTRTPHQLATLRFVEKFCPDMVVFLTGVNDWNRHIQTEFRAQSGFSFLRRYFNYWRFPLTKAKDALTAVISGSTGPTGTSIAAGTLVVRNVEDTIWKRGSLDRTTKLEFRPNDVSKAYQNNMREIFDHCGKGAYVCIFLTQPNGYTLTPTDNLPAYLSATPPSTSYTLTMESLVHISSLYNSWLIREACERGYPVIDIEQKLPKTLAIHYDDVHFTELGTEMLADAVIAYVKPLLAGDPLPATACDGSE